MDTYEINERGEKVLVSSRRPDGTLRKERRIRAGYTPQDEQPVYQSQGIMTRQNVPKCPGLDASAASSAPSAAKSKAAKKNEKRKAKKADGPAEPQQPSGSAAATAAPAAKAVPAAAAAPAGRPAAAPAAAPAADGAAAVLDKQVKALSKKVRQCQALVDKQAGGEALSPQEQEKVAKMAGWQEEIKQLEHEMAKLGM